MAYFPMFVNLSGKNCLIVGGGVVAARKVKVMQDFGMNITVVSSSILPEIEKYADVSIIYGNFSSSMLERVDVVIAATDDKSLNAEVAKLCRQRNIPVNAVDSAENSSFIFPSYIKKGDVVAAFSSSGQSPVVTQYLKEKNRNILTGDIADIAAYLGAVRQDVKNRTEYESQRKVIFQRILEFALREGRLPTEDETEEIIRGVKDIWKEPED